jgi:hypothetical protein
MVSGSRSGRANQAALVLSLSISNGLAALTWHSEAGKAFRVQFQDLLSAPWTRIPPDITATNSTSTTAYSTGAIRQRFFRLIQLP